MVKKSSSKGIKLSSKDWLLFLAFALILLSNLVLFAGLKSLQDQLDQASLDSVNSLARQSALETCLKQGTSVADCNFPEKFYLNKD